jgi:hypothetical protein
MTSSNLSSRLLFAAAIVALAFTGGGCGREACFTWSQVEGSCPAQADALPFFTNPKCPGKVLSVDSEGASSLDGTLCCYQVTQRELTDESLCQGFGGASPSESSSFVSSTGQGGFGAASTTGAGGSASCAHCSDAFGFAPTQQPLCPGSDALFKTMFGCACGGACSADCGDTFCAGNPTGMACFTCLEDKAGCQAEFSACANDL